MKKQEFEGLGDLRAWVQFGRWNSPRLRTPRRGSVSRSGRADKPSFRVDALGKRNGGNSTTTKT